MPAAATTWRFYAPADGGRRCAADHRGIALGIIASAEIEQKSLDLAPGDVVLFYTDGVTDASNPAGESVRRGAAGRRCCPRTATQPAEAIADAIEAAVAEFVGRGSASTTISRWCW